MARGFYDPGGKKRGLGKLKVTRRQMAGEEGTQKKEDPQPSRARNPLRRPGNGL